jgi:DNA replication protein DnaC
MKEALENIVSNVKVTDEPSDVCPRCKGTEWEEVEGKGVRPCSCKNQRLVRTYLEQARIPVRYAIADFSNYEANTPQLQRALQVSQKFVDDYPAEYGLLYLGNPGLGKTHLACSVLKRLIEKGCSGVFYDFRDLLQEIRASFNPVTQSSEHQILKPIFDVEVLVLDELGADKPTEWVQATMTHIINRRYNDKKATIFTTNYMNVAAAVSDETLEQRIGMRFRSRLKEMCRQVVIEGTDYREIIMRRQSVGVRK